MHMCVQFRGVGSCPLGLAFALSLTCYVLLPGLLPLGWPGRGGGPAERGSGARGAAVSAAAGAAAHPSIPMTAITTQGRVAHAHPLRAATHPLRAPLAHCARRDHSGEPGPAGIPLEPNLKSLDEDGNVLVNGEPLFLQPLPFQPLALVRQGGV